MTNHTYQHTTRRVVLRSAIGGRILHRGIYRTIVDVRPGHVVLDDDEAKYGHAEIAACVDQMGVEFKDDQ